MRKFPYKFESVALILIGVYGEIWEERYKLKEKKTVLNKNQLWPADLKYPYSIKSARYYN